MRVGPLTFSDTTDAASFYCGATWKLALEEHLKKPYVGVAGLPLYRCRSLRGPSALVSVPFRDRGGFETDEIHAIESGIRDAIDVAKRLRAGRITINHANETQAAALERNGFKRVDRGIECVLDLEGSYEQFLERLKPSLRWSIRKSAKEGVRVVATAEEADRLGFYSLFRSFRKSMGVANVPYPFFHSLLEARGESVLLLAKSLQNEIEGGLICFRDDSEAYSGYLAYKTSSVRRRVVDSLFSEAIRWAFQNKLQRFNFGTDSANQKTLIDYKRKWLGAVVGRHRWHFWIRKERSLNLDTETTSFRFARAAFRNAPGPLYDFLSRMSLRYWE